MNLYPKKSSFYILLISTISMIVLMYFQGKPLRTTATPAGIISLELAPAQMDVDAILDTWHEASTDKTDLIKVAIINTWIGFGFLVVYSLFFLVAVIRLNIQLPGTKSWIVWLAILAGVLDVIENMGLLKSLYLQGSDRNAMMTATAAYFKYISVFTLLAFLLARSVVFYGKKMIGVRQK